MSDGDDWREKAMEAYAILKKISEPPLQLATLTNVGEEYVDVALTGGNTFTVSYDPRLKSKLKIGQTVRLNPESMAVVAVAGEVKTHGTAVVKDVLKDGRVKIESRGGIEKIIPSAVKNIKAGDSVIVDNGYSVVLENLGNSSKAYSLDKVPEVPWSSIGGLEAVIEELKDAVELPFEHREIFKKYPNKKPAKGILVYGPPGCGKTMLGKGLAYNMALKKREKNGGELNGYFLYVAGPEFLQSLVGAGEAKIRELVGTARRTASENHDPLVVFIDEPEAVFRQRGGGLTTIGGYHVTDSLVNQLLVEMDGLNETDNIVFMFATNRPELLDSALMRPGRIDRKIYVPRPKQSGAEQIFEIYLDKMPLAPKKGHAAKELKSVYAQHAATEIFGQKLPLMRLVYSDSSEDTLEYKHVFSGAAAVSIIGRATDYAIKRAIKEESGDLTCNDLSKAVAKEYHENRGLANIVTKDDVQAVAGDKFDEIVRTEMLYNGCKNGA